MNGREAEGTSQTLGYHKPGSQEGGVSWRDVGRVTQKKGKKGVGPVREHWSMWGTSWLFHMSSESAILQPDVNKVV